MYQPRHLPLALALQAWAAYYSIMMAHAQPAPPQARARGRELEGHGFVVSSLLPGPFVLTEVATETGFGYADESYLSGDAARMIDSKTALLAQRLNVQLALLPAWGIRLSLRGAMQLAVNSDAALYRGADLTYAVSGGTVVSRRLGRLLVGATLDGEYAPTYSLNVLQALNRSIEGMAINTDTLFTKGTLGQVSLVAQAALAPLHSIGVHAALGYQHLFSEDQVGRSQAGQLLLGGAGSFQLAPALRAPLGVSLGYQATLPLLGIRDFRHELAAGLLYTGRPHLGFGLDLRVTLLAKDGAASERRILGLLVMRHTW